MNTNKKIIKNTVVRPVDENILKIELPEDVVNYLQRLAYEYDAYKDNITFLLDSKRDDANLLESGAFKKYSELQSRTKAEYEEAKLDVQQRFVPSDLSDNHKVNWEINFSTRELIITVLCECGVEALKKLKLKGDN